MQIQRMYKPKRTMGSTTSKNNNATKLANMLKKTTSAPSPAAAPRSNRFSRQAAKTPANPEVQQNTPQQKIMQAQYDKSKMLATLKNATPAGPAQQAIKAVPNIPQANTAMQRFNTAQTGAMQQSAKATNTNNLALAQANNVAKATPAPKPTAAPQSNRFSRQAAKAAPKPMMAKGGMVKSNCGASMKPTQKGKK